MRPQYLTPVTDGAHMLKGTVSLTERLGAETVVDVDLPTGSSIIAAISEDRILAPGTEIGLTFDTVQAHLFSYEDIANRPH